MIVFGIWLMKSEAEETLALHIKAEKLDQPEREYRFHSTRKWRFDFVWPAIKFAVEVEGIVWRGQGRHQTAQGYEKDCEKYEAAMLDGWIVYRCTQNMVKTGRAIETIKKMMEVLNEQA